MHWLFKIDNGLAIPSGSTVELPIQASHESLGRNHNRGCEVLYCYTPRWY